MASVAPAIVTATSIVDDEIPSTVARTLLLSKNDTIEERNERMKQYVFTPPTDELLDSYQINVVNAIRNSDLPTLRTLLQSGHNMNACNRNGETLLHMACRCCSMEIVQFLCEEARVNVNVIDSVGRTVLHDICWRHKLDVELMEMFINRIHSDFFILPDKRGHTCFDYARKEHYNVWNTFIRTNAKAIIESSSSSDVVEDKEEGVNSIIHKNEYNNSKDSATPTTSEVVVSSLPSSSSDDNAIKNEEPKDEKDDEKSEVADILASIADQDVVSFVRKVSSRNTVVQQQQPQVRKTSMTLKRKDSKSGDDTSSTTSEESSSARSLPRCRSSVDIYNDHDDETHLNEPLKKKSNSMVDLTSAS